MTEALSARLRETEQRLMPGEVEDQPGGGYSLYPAHPVAEGTIEIGHDRIAELLKGQATATFDGYVGVQWELFRSRLEAHLSAIGIEAVWHNATEWMLPPDEIEKLIEPHLGGGDPLFGKRYEGVLADFFGGTPTAPEEESHEPGRIDIAYGCGAALASWGGPLFYLDLPKNELQFRSRAGAVKNLGAEKTTDPKPQYKRFYFVDWVVLNRHKQEILSRVDWIIDEQNAESPTITDRGTFLGALEELSTTAFRVRPWFEPGPWGGQWLKQLAPELPTEPPNYAWSFELIVPENGLILSDGRHRLEFSFDWLMYAHHRAVLGACADRFEYEFPIRFDYLDTMEGGNLSVQCHPRTDYAREHFGETFTQDECYYLVDCKPTAKVYLGFREGVDPEAFRSDLRRGLETGEPVDVDKHVLSHAAEKHGLYLIPNGTVHCSGADCMVLEISATPYIFTFKMYDWQRMGLDGKPRPLNIDRAFANLDFSRQGAAAEAELISKPRVVESGKGWRIVLLPTHQEHFYEVHRLEFEESIEVPTQNSAQVMMLVEGTRVTCESNGRTLSYAFGETFVVPAAAGLFRLQNEGVGEARVIKADIKPSHATLS